jgi:hypothetical protein
MAVGFFKFLYDTGLGRTCRFTSLWVMVLVMQILNCFMPLSQNNNLYFMSQGLSRTLDNHLCNRAERDPKIEYIFYSDLRLFSRFLCAFVLKNGKKMIIKKKICFGIKNCRRIWL